MKGDLLGEFIWILGGGNDPVALPGLSTLEERRRAGCPLAARISASGLLVWARISCDLALLQIPSPSAPQQPVGRPEG